MTERTAKILSVILIAAILVDIVSLVS